MLPTASAAASSCALLLDIDGTLIDSTYHHALAWQRAFRRCDLDVVLYRIHRSIGIGGDKLVPHLVGEDVEKRHGDWLRTVWREEYGRLVAEVEPLPGAAELVRRAAQAGLQVALASSGDPQFAEQAMEQLGIRGDVHALTTSADVDGSKPEPDLIDATLSALCGVTHAVLVGDTPYDVGSARGAGIDCIGLRSGGFSEAELVEAGAVLVVHTTADLLEIEWVDYCRPVAAPDAEAST